MIVIVSIDELGPGVSRADLLVAKRPAGSLTMPVTVIRGKARGPTLLVVAGTHPTEYAGVEAAVRLSTALKPEDVNGTIVVAPFVNIIGFNARTPGGCPEDLTDIFGIFPGRLGSTVGQTIAYEVFEKLVLKSDFVVDLHGGELNESAAVSLAWYSTAGSPDVVTKSKAMARSFAPDFLLDSSEVWFGGQRAPFADGLLINQAAKKGIAAIIGEGGGSGVSGDEGSDRLYGGVVSVARSLGVLRGRPRVGRPIALKDLTLLGVKKDGLLYCKVHPGQKVSDGQVLAEVRHWDGTVLQRIKAPFDGMVTITVNWLPVRAGEYALAAARFS